MISVAILCLALGMLFGAPIGIGALLIVVFLSYVCNK